MFDMFSWFFKFLSGFFSLQILVYPFAAFLMVGVFGLVYRDLLGIRRRKR